ncbi:MAG: DMT family transporter [Proteobacteria bacterium]|nr:DMT family transporter [Pseudomonadota bacterium]
MSGAPNRPALAVLLVLIAFGVFSLVNLFVKWLGQGYPVIEILFFRNLFALIPSGAIALSTPGFAAFRTKRLGGHLWRMVFGQGSLFCMFMSFQFMPLADAVAISFATPLFVTVLSVPLLGERVGVHRLGAVVAGFVGVLVIVQPTGMVANVGTLFALANAAIYACAVITMRQLGRTEAGATMAFYYALFSTPAAGLFVPFVWVTPAPADLALMLACGLIAGVGQYLTSQAYRFGEAGLVSPFLYSSILWSALLDAVFFDVVPTAALIVGTAILVASGLYILQRERKAKPA